MSSGSHDAVVVFFVFPIKFEKTNTAERSDWVTGIGRGDAQHTQFGYTSFCWPIKNLIKKNKKFNLIKGISDNLTLKVK